MAGLLIAGLAAGGFGCWKRPPNDAWINQNSPQEKYRADRIPSPDENQRMLEAIRGTATPPDQAQRTAAENPPLPGESVAVARYGRRWSDIPAAVNWAAGLSEMAIWQKSLSEDGKVWTFTLITAKDEPGTLVVERRPPPQIYEATATIGLFGNHSEAARRLLEAVDATLLRYGQKPAPKLMDD